MCVGGGGEGGKWGVFLQKSPCFGLENFINSTEELANSNMLNLSLTDQKDLPNQTNRCVSLTEHKNSLTRQKHISN